MNRLCGWCRKPIDPARHPFVARTTKLGASGKMQKDYHASPCYPALIDFEKLHEFQPLDPATHDHG